MRRRDLLIYLSVIPSLGLAGCTDGTDRQSGNTPTGTEGGDDNGDDDDNGGNGGSEPQISYKLELSADPEINLTDLPVGELDGFTDIRDEDYLNLEYTITEYLGDEEQGEIDLQELDNLEIKVNRDEYDLGPEIDTAYDIACTELEEGENTVTVTAEINGETETETTTVEKIVPEAHLLEAHIDGEPITSYSSPYQFDTHNMDKEEYRRRRAERAEERAKNNILDHIDTERLEETLNDSELSEKERKRHALFYIGLDVMELTGRHSAHAQLQARSEEYALRELTDFDEIYGNGFDNPADITSDKSGNHGSKAFYIDGDWYHRETIGPETLHAENFESMDMISGTVNPDFVSVLGEFQEGEMETVRFSTKMSRMNEFYGGQFGLRMETGAAVTDEYGSQGLEMIRNNENRDSIMNPVEVAATHGIENDKYISIMGTPDNPVLLASENGDIVRQIWNEKEFQETNTILEEAL